MDELDGVEIIAFPDAEAFESWLAKKAFEALDKTGRYLVILPLIQALTPETRQVRLDKALQMLVNGEIPG
ncbi:YdeI/OmpD-associated family protein [Streptomyces sp. V1I1]|uniref:YdeI/OmpD-associated family protein n=1 Tax=Streptomyces sp. V1I1 TaxID=3042272 RepID=UPI00278AE097|nr:YdeI/OmpD-associated family protein [Streptomyces sp. V1I1]MDQ0944739.1 uncharacterized protein YdeI (YjbR/CyaY-like superfamily) [Streptomyces sp. V1I1]